MIDLTTVQSASESIEVLPSDQIFSELGKNTYDYKDLLSELIDNCIAARIDGKPLLVTIDIYVDEDGNAKDFVIRDNAKGIPVDILAQAVSPAGRQSKNSLNEHGMGMKQAVGALGKLKYLATKTEGESKARLIKQFKYGNISVFPVDFDFDTGTEIALSDVSAAVVTNATNYTRSIVPYLGARYRRFLKHDNKSLTLEIRINGLEQPSQVLNYWSVEDVKPIYFHPSTRQNQPVILKHRLEGQGWEAQLTFGYAPMQKEEYDELGLVEPNKFHPYRVSLNTQGLDVLFHDRVILFHQLSEINIITSKHNDYNNIRGEIELIRGFSTAITKNSIIYDHHFRECIDQVRKILEGKEPGPGKKPKDYITSKTYPDAIPEKLLRDRLVEWLLHNPVAKNQNVKKEYVVGGIEGYIDIYADGVAWELKIDQAQANDVYQLFMYMDVGGLDKGYLIAKSFTTGAQAAADHINDKHHKQITLASRDQFPINHPPTDSERSKYY